MTSPGSVLRKKLRPPKPKRGRSHIALERRADDLFRRAAKDGMGLDLSVANASVTPMPRAAAFEQMPELAAWYILSNGAEALGLALLDGDALDAIIEFETLGRVTSTTRGARPVTRIDAAIGQQLLDGALDALATMLPNSPELEIAQPFKVVRQEWDRPTLDLLLDLPTYNVMSVELDFGPGGKTGQVQLWLPGSNTPTDLGSGQGQANPAMQDALADVETRLDTRVKGVRIPLSTLVRLTVGSEIRLPADCLTRVVIMEPSGREVLSARLGQLNGARALRITGPARARRKADTAEMTDGLAKQVPAGDAPSAALSAPDANSLDAVPDASAALMAEPLDEPAASSSDDGLPAPEFTGAPVSVE